VSGILDEVRVMWFEMFDEDGTSGSGKRWAVYQPDEPVRVLVADCL